MLYGTITEFCISQEVLAHYARIVFFIYLFVSAPLCRLDHGKYLNVLLLLWLMSFSFEYLWEDGQKYKRPTKLSAPDYVDALLNWAQAILEDESVFPNKIGISC